MLPPILTFNERFGPIRYVMAPMAGITDMVYRLLMRKMGADAVVSELLSAEGLVRGGKKTREMLAFDERERPIGIQIFGGEIKTLQEAAKIVQEEGADFVDINFGCPVKKVVCDGAGAAWLKDPERMGEMLGQVKQSLRVPLTIKVRTGWDESSINVGRVIEVAAEAGVSWVAIHGRTRAQGYSGNANWELIREVAHQSKIPVIGNGDILTANDAKQRLADGYSHAVMIGRGALKNPWIFQEIKDEIVERDFLELIEEHFSLAIEKKDRQRAYLSLKKFLAWYAAGFPYCSAFRARVFDTRDIEELKKISIEYFSGVNGMRSVDDGKPFLMGGHG